MVSINICTHFRKLTDLSLPMIVNALIQEAQYTSTMIFVGRLGEAKYLGAATLGNMLCNITGYSLAFGLCSALDTLIAQAYGAKAYSLMGLHAQRAAIIMTIFAIPVAVIWWKTDWIIYHLMGIDREIATLAGYWARWILLGLWPTLMFQVLRKLLQSGGIVWPVIVASLISTIANVVSNYVTIYVLGWGFDGAAMSVSIAQWAGFLSLAFVFYLQVLFARSNRKANSSCPGDIEMSSAKNVVFSSLPQDDITLDTEMDGESFSTIDFESESVAQASAVSSAPNSPCRSVQALADSFIPAFPIEEVLPAWSYKVWTHWYIFLELGMPGAMSLFLEWGSYELMAMIAGQLGTVELATHGVFMSTCAIIYMVPQAIADATAVIAGNYLGHGDPQEAKSVIALGICYDMCIGLFGASLLLFVLRPYWGGIFTSDAAVQQEVYDKLPVMFVYITVDSMKCISLNILRSTGRPQVTAWGNILCCLLIMLPLGWYLSMDLHYGLWGVWGSMSVGWFAATVVYLTVLYFTDWNIQADLAAKRNAVDAVNSNIDEE